MKGVDRMSETGEYFEIDVVQEETEDGNWVMVQMLRWYGIRFVLPSALKGEEVCCFVGRQED